MAEKSAASSSSSGNGAQLFLLILFALGIFLLMTGRLGEGKPSRGAAQPASVDPAVKKYIGKIERHDRLEAKDRRELQDLVDKVGK